MRRDLLLQDVVLPELKKLGDSLRVTLCGTSGILFAFESASKPTLRLSKTLRAVLEQTMAFMEDEHWINTERQPKKHFWKRIFWTINKNMFWNIGPRAQNNLCQCGRYYCDGTDHQLELSVFRPR